MELIATPTGLEATLTAARQTAAAFSVKLQKVEDIKNSPSWYVLRFSALPWRMAKALTNRLNVLTYGANYVVIQLDDPQ